MAIFIFSFFFFFFFWMHRSHLSPDLILQPAFLSSETSLRRRNPSSTTQIKESKPEFTLEERRSRRFVLDDISSVANKGPFQPGNVPLDVARAAHSRCASNMASFHTFLLRCYANIFNRRCSGFLQERIKFNLRFFSVKVLEARVSHLSF